MKELSFDDIKKLSKSTWIVSLLYAIFFVFGKYASLEKYIDFANYKVYLLIFLVFLPINLICIILFKFFDLKENIRKDKNVENRNFFGTKKTYILVFIIMIVLWIPQWISLFPGCFNYDAREIWEQYINNRFIAQYPPLYSLILITFLNVSAKVTSGYAFGIAAYTVLQMIISAIIFTYSIYVMNKYGVSDRIKIFSLFYYSLFPAVYLYVLSFTKDSLFNCFFYLSFLLYLQLLKYGEDTFNKKKCFLLIISNALFILLRRNAIYSYMIFNIILFISMLFKGKNKIKIILLILLPVIISSIVNNILYKILNVEEESNIGGILSVPIQQIAYVYNNNYESLTENQKDKILGVASDEIITNYYPEVSDSIIYYIYKPELIKNSREYLKLWLDIGKGNIPNYLNAWVILDYGYFYPDAIQKVYTRNGSYEKRSFSQNWFIIGIPENYDNIFSDLTSLNINYSSGILQEIPIIKYVFSIGAFLWLFMFSISYSIYKRKRNFVYASVLISVLLTTYVLGPLVMLRYYLILFYAFPIIIGTILNNEKFD